MRNMKDLLIFTSILFLVSCFSKQQDKFEDPVVKLNENILTGSDFAKILVRKFIEQDIKYPKQEIISVLKKQIVEDFIIQSVFNDFAEENNVLVKKEMLDQELNEFVKNYPDNDSFEIFLNESGQNKLAFKSSLKDKIVRDLVKDLLFEKQEFSIETGAVTEYYNKNKDIFKTENQIKLKQIVFESEEDGIKILELLKKDNNKNFETFAEKYSLGPEKVNGGDLGWVNISSFPAFEEASKSGVGQVTDIIKSENGFHIFKIVDKKKEAIISLSEADKKIRGQLLADKKNIFLNDWIKERVKNSKVKVNQDLLSNIVVTRPTSF